MLICRAPRDGKVCVKHAGHLSQQHQAADGQVFYYQDGERERIEKMPLIRLVAEYNPDSDKPVCQGGPRWHSNEY